MLGVELRLCMANALSQGSWVLEREEIPREVLQGAADSQRSDCFFFLHGGGKGGSFME